MLKEFYDFIAQRINIYFQNLSAQNLLDKGASYCLKLDDEDMVKCVNNALQNLAESEMIKGEYGYRDVYETFSLKLKNDEIIIAAQYGGMTSDFLCATLRNAANEADIPILMISSSPIDSALSGTIDMAANGMPFHAEKLMGEITNKVRQNNQLTKTEKCVLKFELSRKGQDVFSDSASLFEYKDLLAIISTGEIKEEEYSEFRLFAIDGKCEYVNCSEKQIERELKENYALFEKLDRSVRYGNVKIDFSDDFSEAFLDKIEKRKNEDVENWSKGFYYSQLQRELDKKLNSKSRPLQIDDDGITAYHELPFNDFSENERLFIRNDGTMTGKKRTRSILIFDTDKTESVSLKIECNIRILSRNIFADDAILSKEEKSLIFTFRKSGIHFHKIELKDEENTITYIFKICIMDIDVSYLIPTIKTMYQVDYKKNRENSSIKLLGCGVDLTFHAQCAKRISVKLEEKKRYVCRYNECLHIYTTEEELSDLGRGMKVEIDFSGTMVPFTLYPEETKSAEITGRKILQEKFVTKTSFTFLNNGQIFGKTQEYYAKEHLLKELRLEQQIISEHIISGQCICFDNINQMRCIKEELDIPKNLADAYFELLNQYKKQQTLPTLSYISEELQIYVEKYLDAFYYCFENLTESQPLSSKQESLLKLGTIFVNDCEKELLLTPFHPINMSYQLMLKKEKGMGRVLDVVIERLNSNNLMPYIQVGKQTYKVSEQLYSKEWKHYAPVENKKYMGSRKYVSKLVEEKIREYIAHFEYIFDDISNRKIKVNLINMGDCSEILQGIAQYYIRSVNKNADIDKLTKFEVHIYTNARSTNVFSKIKDYTRLKEYLDDLKLVIAPGVAMSSLEGIIAKLVNCYFYQDNNQTYEYAHITFYEMESELNAGYATMNQVDTGISLAGLLSGIPSGKYGQRYRTGFGSKYAKSNTLTKMAVLYNSLVRIGNSGNPYQSDIGISTQIDIITDEKIKKIYKDSNWVVFIEPKVDLDFFYEKEAKSDLLIIHYSDQYTSSSGYDAITVTHKSTQYARVIREFLDEKGVGADLEAVNKIINLFNAINGAWLLRLVSSKKIVGNQNSTFSREKISIVAAIKFMLAYLKHKDMLWIPISMEEMLRVSGGAGMSQKDGVLSAKNLGFDDGPTCDDLLMVGIRNNKVPIVYLYPIEVKTGDVNSSTIKKALIQVSKTVNGFEEAFTPTELDVSDLSVKVNRNFMMQLLITSCKKMKVYHVDDSQDWNMVIEQFREALLNEEYVIKTDIREVLGKGAVLSFKKDIVSRTSSFKEDTINYIEMPEKDEYDFILKSVEDIVRFIESEATNFISFSDIALETITGDMSTLNVAPFITNPIEIDNTLILDEEIVTKEDVIDNNVSEVYTYGKKDSEPIGIEVELGINLQNGKKVFWHPNNTNEIFHTNTGIIGTMGTGKTQFTRSFIAQIYRERAQNPFTDDIGILIFDYKGDYNEEKKDFTDITEAKIYKPYHLPFNPFALSWSGIPKPLLPVHTANTFVDTLAKVFPNLGPKQKGILLDCIDLAYSRCGIQKSNSGTWEKKSPTFHNVYQIYSNDDDIKKGDVLDAALRKIERFEILEPVSLKTQSLFELLHGVVVIDLSGYDSDIQNLIVAITLDIFYSQMQAGGHSVVSDNLRQIKKMILVDEADNFLRGGYSSLRKIMKEGREYGVGTILSTQFLKHFITKDEDFSKYILTWIVHKVDDLNLSDVRFIFNSSSGSSMENQLYSDIRTLKTHESIIKLGNYDKPIYIRDRAFWEYIRDLNLSNNNT